MMTGKGPPRSGWVMKVVVWPSLVGTSICWSIMALFSLSRFGRSIRLQGNQDMTRQLAGSPCTAPFGSPLSCLVPSAHSRAEISHDPDHEPVFRRDRTLDE